MLRPEELESLVAELVERPGHEKARQFGVYAYAVNSGVVVFDRAPRPAARRPRCDSTSFMGIEDVNRDGVLRCTGAYWIDTGTWVGNCL